MDVAPPKFDKANNRLTVTVRAKQSHESMDPPCKVELDLNSQVIPGLEKFKAARSQGQLSGKAGEDKIQLYAQDFVLRRENPQKAGEFT